MGTNNFDNRSMAFNDESVLVVHDPEVGGRLEALFHADLHWAREVRLEAFVRRSAADRARERAASLLSRVL